jgi:hypothetical protein
MDLCRSIPAGIRFPLPGIFCMAAVIYEGIVTRLREDYIRLIKSKKKK